MRILISNDDGVHAPGLRALQKELSKLADVWVVAPLEEKSTTGHSLTIHKPLRLIPMGDRFYGVSGSPADCVNVGVKFALKKRPDWVISGINRGANLGQDVYYSGTVSAAREACIMGIRSMAVSLNIDFSNPPREDRLHYESAAKYAALVIRKMSKLDMPDHTLLNLNCPDLPFKKVKGLQVVRQGFRYYSGEILKRTDHRGKDYFWLGGTYRGFRKDRETDCHAIDGGYASLTPLKLDSTDIHYMVALSESWSNK